MLNLITHDAIVEINLARPPVNALNVDLLRALRDAVNSAVAGGARGIVLSGQPGMYSAGVDVPSLLGRDRDGVREFWREFFQTTSVLAMSPIPIVAAITGHSPAGGAVLSLVCDYRVMAEGPFKIGLNEVQVGLVVPESIQMALRRIVGPYRAERLMVAGAMIESSEALAVGLVDELTNAEQVVTRSLVWMQGMLALPSNAMLKTRAIARADLTAVWARPEELPIDGFLDAYFHPETQAVLEKLVARLKKKD